MATDDRRTGILDQQQQARAAAREAAARFDLTGHVALVTGCAGRLGRIWTRVLRDAGALVVGTDTADAMRGDSPFKGCDDGVADITQQADVDRLCSRLCGVYGPPTILLNNAGVDDRPRAGVLNGPRYETAQAMVDVNLMGTYRMIQTFGPYMAQAPGSTIINLASLYGTVVPDMRYYGTSGFEKHAMYGATKAGIMSLTKYFAAYFGDTLRVNALAPGGVIDPNDPLTGKDDTFKTNYTNRIPMGRMCTPEDLAGPLVFLASKASSFMTGQTLILDGGFTCW